MKSKTVKERLAVQLRALRDIRKIVERVLANSGWEYGDEALNMAEAVKAILDRVDGEAT